MPEAKLEEIVAKLEGIVCEDRISALPEDLLVEILLLIPIKDAVTTMILSKRWRFIWTMLPRLEYKDNEEDTDESKNSICCFLDKSLQLNKAPVIDSLCMELGPRCSTDANVREWIEKAVDRRVLVLKFNLLWSREPVRLPKSLYTSGDLAKLSLSHKILVDFPSSSCLPSLKDLKLCYVVYENEASLVRFLSSCPALEYLFVRRNRNDNVKKFTVKVPSLRFLEYTYTYNYKDVGDTGRCLVIDTPALDRFTLVDMSGDHCSIENMPCLEDASIFVESNPDVRLSRSLASVFSLHLFMNNDPLVWCGAIKFSRLIKLSICPVLSDWLEPLMILLGNAPKLKNLIVDYDFIDSPEDLPLSWNQPNYVPICLSSQLEMFEWIEYGNREEEEEFLTYILANSKCLKTTTISISSTFDRKEQEEITELLTYIARVSTSQLLFIQEK